LRRPAVIFQYSNKPHRSQKRIRLCVYFFQIEDFDPKASLFASEEPGEFAIDWHPRLVPLAEPFSGSDRDPDKLQGPRISAASASCESEARPN